MAKTPTKSMTSKLNKKPIVAKANAIKAKPKKTFTPNDYIRGSKVVGESYTGYGNYGQGVPTFGKGKGPGTPYQEATRKNIGRSYATQKPVWTPPSGAGGTYRRPASGAVTGDPRTSAIRRRLGWI